MYKKEFWLARDDELILFENKPTLHIEDDMIYWEESNINDELFWVKSIEINPHSDYSIGLSWLDDPILVTIEIHSNDIQLSMDASVLFRVNVYIVKELDGIIYAFQSEPYKSHHPENSIWSKDYNSYLIIDPNSIDFNLEFGEIIIGTMVARI